MKIEAKAGTTLSFTIKQKEIFDDIRANTGGLNLSLSNYLFIVYSYAQEAPLVYQQYFDFLEILLEKGTQIKVTVRNENESIRAYKVISQQLKDKWIRIPMKGVVLMYCLHYAKSKFGLDICKYL